MHKLNACLDQDVAKIVSDILIAGKNFFYIIYFNRPLCYQLISDQRQTTLHYNLNGTPSSKTQFQYFNSVYIPNTSYNFQHFLKTKVRPKLKMSAEVFHFQFQGAQDANLTIKIFKLRNLYILLRGTNT